MTAWRQLDLLKGPRQRGTRPPPALEFETHCAIADMLRVSLSPKWTWFHPPNGGERPATYRNGKRVSGEGGRLKRMGARAGTSDFILVAPALGRVHALELKRRGETPTDAQAAFLDEIRAAGGLADWCDNFNDAKRILSAWGAIRTSLKVAV